MSVLDSSLCLSLSLSIAYVCRHTPMPSNLFPVVSLVVGSIEIELVLRLACQLVYLFVMDVPLLLVLSLVL